MSFELKAWLACGAILSMAAPLGVLFCLFLDRLRAGDLLPDPEKFSEAFLSSAAVPKGVTFKGDPRAFVLTTSTRNLWAIIQTPFMIFWSLGSLSFLGLLIVLLFQEHPLLLPMPMGLLALWVVVRFPRRR